MNIQSGIRNIDSDQFIMDSLRTVSSTFSALIHSLPTIDEVELEQNYGVLFSFQIDLTNFISEHKPGISYFNAFRVSGSIINAYLYRAGWPINFDELKRDAVFISDSLSVMNELPLEPLSHAATVNTEINSLRSQSILKIAVRLSNLYHLFPMRHAQKYLLDYSIASIADLASKFVNEKNINSSIRNTDFVSQLPDALEICTDYWCDTWVSFSLKAVNPSASVLTKFDLDADLEIFEMIVSTAGYGHEMNSAQVKSETIDFILHMAKLKSNQFKGILSEGQCEILMLPIAKSSIAPLAQTAWNRILEATCEKVKRMDKDAIIDWLETDVNGPLPLGIFFNELKQLVDIRPKLTDLIKVDPEIVEEEFISRFEVGKHLAASVNWGLANG